MTPDDGRDVREIKAALRCAMRAVRKGFDHADLQEASRSIAARAGSVPALARAKVIATYLAIRREIPTEPFREALPGMRWAIPRIEGRKMVMVEHNVPLVDGAHGIPTCEGPPVAVDALLIPGLAFDREGWRLGWGGGFYDRYLAAHGGFAIGVALDEAIVDLVPHGDHDQTVDAVITPSRVIFPDSR